MSDGKHLQSCLDLLQLVINCIYISDLYYLIIPCPRNVLSWNLPIDVTVSNWVAHDMDAMQDAVIALVRMPAAPQLDVSKLVDVVQRVVHDYIRFVDVRPVPSFSVVLVVFESQLFERLVVREDDDLLVLVLPELLLEPCRLYAVLLPRCERAERRRVLVVVHVAAYCPQAVLRDRRPESAAEEDVVAVDVLAVVAREVGLVRPLRVLGRRGAVPPVVVVAGDVQDLLELVRCLLLDVLQDRVVSVVEAEVAGDDEVVGRLELRRLEVAEMLEHEVLHVVVQGRYSLALLPVQAVVKDEVIDVRQAPGPVEHLVLVHVREPLFCCRNELVQELDCLRVALDCEQLRVGVHHCRRLELELAE